MPLPLSRSTTCSIPAAAPPLACEAGLEGELPMAVARRSPPLSSCAQAALPALESPRADVNAPLATGGAVAPRQVLPGLEDAEARARAGALSQSGRMAGDACSRCGGSGMLRLGDQRYRTCLDCLGSGRLSPAAMAGVLRLNRLNAAASSVCAG